MIGVVIPEEVSIFIGLFRIFLIRGRVCGEENQAKRKGRQTKRGGAGEKSQEQQSKTKKRKKMGENVEVRSERREEKREGHRRNGREKAKGEWQLKNAEKIMAGKDVGLIEIAILIYPPKPMPGEH